MFSSPACTSIWYYEMAKGFGNRILPSPALTLRNALGGESTKERKRKPFLTLFPNGQFSLSYKYSTDSESTSEDEEWKCVHGGVTRGPQRSAPDPNLVSTRESSQTESGRAKSTAKYGLKGISRYGCKMVRSAAWMLQKEYGRLGLTFMTLTVPALPHEERRLVALKWGEIMRQVVQKLSRLLQRAGQPKVVVSVTELQSARLKRYAQAYLHAHIVFPARARGSKDWVCDVSEFRTWYKALLERVIGRELSALPRVETKLVRKSVEGYLGKYMTKGSEGMQGIIDDVGEDCVPGQQWNMSSLMRSLVKSQTVKSWEYGDLMQYHIERLVAGDKDIPAYLKRVEIDIGGRVITTAWVGNLGESCRCDLGLPGVDRCVKISVNRDLEERNANRPQQAIAR